MKNLSLIGKRLLVGVIALQLLNLSICSEAYWDYDSLIYSSTNEKYDPTETILEWVIEIKYGQQKIFSYDHDLDSTKNISKHFHFQTDLQRFEISNLYYFGTLQIKTESVSSSLYNTWQEIQYPPPRESFFRIA
jgi:hypothetical protein